MPAQTMTSDRAAPVVGSDGSQFERRWWILVVIGLAQLMVCVAMQSPADATAGESFPAGAPFRLMSPNWERSLLCQEAVAVCGFLSAG